MTDPHIRRLVIAYANRYAAEDGPVPPTDEDIERAMRGIAIPPAVSLYPEIRKAILETPYVDAAVAIARAVHRIACYDRIGKTCGPRCRFLAARAALDRAAPPPEPELPVAPSSPRQASLF